MTPLHSPLIRPASRRKGASAPAGAAKRTTRWLAGAAAAAGLLGLGAAAAPAASAQTTQPTLGGEVLTASSYIPVTCQDANAVSFTVTGTATGPYPGTFTETLSEVLDGPPVQFDYTATFTITSAAGVVTGTETAQTPDGIGACSESGGEYSAFGSPGYTATIRAAGQTYTDQGTTAVTWSTFNYPGGGNETFTSSQQQATPAASDLALTDNAPATAISGQPYAYTLTVTNTGGADATGVTVTDTLPASARYNAATASQGTCTPPPGPKGGTVSCNLRTLAAGTSATVTITVTPTKPGTISDRARATACNLAPGSDDTAAATTTIQGT